VTNSKPTPRTSTLGERQSDVPIRGQVRPRQVDHCHQETAPTGLALTRVAPAIRRCAGNVPLGGLRWLQVAVWLPSSAGPNDAWVDARPLWDRRRQRHRAPSDQHLPRAQGALTLLDGLMDSWCRAGRTTQSGTTGLLGIARRGPRRPGTSTPLLPRALTRPYRRHCCGRLASSGAG
jgi:hypothetical protein